MTFLRSLMLILSLSLCSMTTVAAETSSTLDGIRARGYVLCGVGEQDFGFAERNPDGQWHGFDIDLCKAIATATLGKPDKVRFVPVDSQSRLPTLLSGEIDVLLRTTTWTMERDSSLPIDFTRVMLFESQGIIARGDLNITKASEAGKATICVNQGTTSLSNLKQYLEIQNPDLKILVLETQQGRWDAFFNGRCELMSSDRMDLQAGKAMLAPHPEDMVILEDVLSKEPLAPVVRNDDRQWFDIVKWVMNGLITLEEQGITSVNIAEMRQNPTSRHQHLIGENTELAKRLGLDEGWLARTAEDVGNYGEIFNRNLGENSPFKMERGLNKLWTDGGLIYAIPLR